MSRTGLRSYLSRLAHEALQAARGGDGLLQLGRSRVALYNPGADEAVQSLGSYGLSVSVLRELPEFLLIGSRDDADRVVLQFVYDFLKEHPATDFDKRVYGVVWSSFWAELRKSHWTHLAICYLANFQSDSPELKLLSDVSIYSRAAYQFEAHGWSDFQVEKLHEDWSWSATYLIVAKEDLRRAPDNLSVHSTWAPVGRSTARSGRSAYCMKETFTSTARR